MIDVIVEFTAGQFSTLITKKSMRRRNLEILANPFKRNSICSSMFKLQIRSNFGQNLKIESSTRVVVCQILPSENKTRDDEDLRRMLNAKKFY